MTAAARFGAAAAALVLAGATIATGPVAADDREAAIDTFLRRHLEELPIAGFSAVVVEGDRVLFSRGYGVERNDGTKPLTARSPIAIGSQTKSLTAVAVMQLVEAGAVELDAPVTRYLPWLRTADGRQGEITIRMLLHNTSGLPSRDRWLRSRDRSEAAIELGARSLSLEPLVREPGRSFEYANENWSLLGLVIADVAGMPYSRYMDERVLGSMGMRRSTTAYERFDQLDVLWGHYTGIDEVRPARRRFLAEALPAGSELRSTADDMGRYLRMLLNGGVVDGRRILDEATVDLLFEPGIRFSVDMPEMGVVGGEAGYGMGWVEAEIDGRIVHHHGGDAIVMGSWTMLDRDRCLGASLLYNGPLLSEYRYPSRVWAVNNLLHLAAGEATTSFGRPTEEDPTANDFELDPALRSRYLGTYLSADGLRAEVGLDESRDRLEVRMVAGDLDYEYELDFVSEAAVALRNLSGASLGSFLLTPDGEVTGLRGLPGGPFRKRSASEVARLRTVSSPGGELAFALPRSWRIRWDGTRFAARSETGTARLAGEIAASERDAAAAADAEAVETIGGRVWYKSLVSESRAGVATHTLRARTEEAGRRLSFELTAPSAELTATVRDVLFPLLSDLELR